MANLSLPIKQTATIKAVEDAGKNNANQSKLNQNANQTSQNLEARNSFQAMLNRQVETKRMQENQAALKQANKPNSSKSSAQATTQPSEAKQESSAQSTEKSQNKTEATTEQTSINATKQSAKRDKANQANNQVKDDRVAANNEVSDEVLKPSLEQVAAETEIVTEDARLLNAKLKAKEDGRTTEDAALIAALMQDATAANPQVLADVAMKNGRVNGEVLTKSEGESGLEPALDGMLNQKLSKDFQQSQIAVDQSKTLRAEASLGEVPFSESQSRWMDEMATRARPTDLAQTLNNQVTFSQLKERMSDAETLKATLGNEMSNAQNSSVDQNAVNALQAAGANTTAFNHSALAATQVGSSNQIYAYPGKSGWDQAISQKVMWMVGAGEQSATLTLNPPDLGPLQVVISVHDDQADATFISDNADVRQALQDGLEHLREKMESSGIQLGQANVNAGQQSQQSFQEAAQKQSQGQSRQSTFSEVNAPTTPVIRRTVNGLVDTFA
jgi:flagellar hook-length control protein FliK